MDGGSVNGSVRSQHSARSAVSQASKASKASKAGSVAGSVARSVTGSVAGSVTGKKGQEKPVKPLEAVSEEKEETPKLEEEAQHVEHAVETEKPAEPTDEEIARDIAAPEEKEEPLQVPASAEESVKGPGFSFLGTLLDVVLTPVVATTSILGNLGDLGGNFVGSLFTVNIYEPSQVAANLKQCRQVLSRYPEFDLVRSYLDALQVIFEGFHVNYPAAKAFLRKLYEVYMALALNDDIPTVNNNNNNNNGSIIGNNSKASVLGRWKYTNMLIINASASSASEPVSGGSTNPTVIFMFPSPLIRDFEEILHSEIMFFKHLMNDSTQIKQLMFQSRILTRMRNLESNLNTYLKWFYLVAEGKRYNPMFEPVVVSENAAEVSTESEVTESDFTEYPTLGLMGFQAMNPYFILTDIHTLIKEYEETLPKLPRSLAKGNVGNSRVGSDLTTYDNTSVLFNSHNGSVAKSSSRNTTTGSIRGNKEAPMATQEVLDEVEVDAAEFMSRWTEFLRNKFDNPRLEVDLNMIESFISELDEMKAFLMKFERHISYFCKGDLNLVNLSFTLPKHALIKFWQKYFFNRFQVELKHFAAALAVELVHEKIFTSDIKAQKFVAKLLPALESLCTMSDFNDEQLAQLNNADSENPNPNPNPTSSEGNPNLASESADNANVPVEEGYPNPNPNPSPSPAPVELKPELTINLLDLSKVVYCLPNYYQNNPNSQNSNPNPTTLSQVNALINHHYSFEFSIYPTLQLLIKMHTKGSLRWIPNFTPLNYSYLTTTTNPSPSNPFPNPPQVSNLGFAPFASEKELKRNIQTLRKTQSGFLLIQGNRKSCRSTVVQSLLTRVSLTERDVVVIDANHAPSLTETLAYMSSRVGFTQVHNLETFLVKLRRLLDTKLRSGSIVVFDNLESEVSNIEFYRHLDLSVTTTPKDPNQDFMSDLTLQVLNLCKEFSEKHLFVFVGQESLLKSDLKDYKVMDIPLYTDEHLVTYIRNHSNLLTNNYCANTKRFTGGSSSNPTLGSRGNKGGNSGEHNEFNIFAFNTDVAAYLTAGRHNLPEVSFLVKYYPLGRVRQMAAKLSDILRGNPGTLAEVYTLVARDMILTEGNLSPDAQSLILLVPLMNVTLDIGVIWQLAANYFQGDRVRFYTAFEELVKVGYLIPFKSNSGFANTAISEYNPNPPPMAAPVGLPPPPPPAGSKQVPADTPVGNNYVNAMIEPLHSQYVINPHILAASHISSIMTELAESDPSRFESICKQRQWNIYYRYYSMYLQEVYYDSLESPRILELFSYYFAHFKNLFGCFPSVNMEVSMVPKEFNNKKWKAFKSKVDMINHEEGAAANSASSANTANKTKKSLDDEMVNYDRKLLDSIANLIKNQTQSTAVLSQSYPFKMATSKLMEANYILSGKLHQLLNYRFSANAAYIIAKSVFFTSMDFYENVNEYNRLTSAVESEETATTTNTTNTNTKGKGAKYAKDIKSAIDNVDKLIRIEELKSQITITINEKTYIPDSSEIVLVVLKSALDTVEQMHRLEMYTDALEFLKYLQFRFNEFFSQMVHNIKTFVNSELLRQGKNKEESSNNQIDLISIDYCRFLVYFGKTMFKSSENSSVGKNGKLSAQTTQALKEALQYVEIAILYLNRVSQYILEYLNNFNGAFHLEIDRILSSSTTDKTGEATSSMAAPLEAEATSIKNHRNLLKESDYFLKIANICRDEIHQKLGISGSSGNSGNNGNEGGAAAATGNAEGAQAAPAKKSCTIM